MQSVLGKIIRYVWWILLILILSLLLVGLIKYRGDVGAYINFLNARDRNQAWAQLSISEPSSFGYMFRWDEEERIEVEETVSEEIMTGEVSTWLDAYDPSREEELNDMGDDDFWFEDGASDEETSQEELLDLIKERELNN